MRMPPMEVDGHRLRPLVEGAERLTALLDLIGGAARDLRLLYYIFADDESGQAVRAALLDALARGVKVALMLDGFGCTAPRAFFDPLRTAGADICLFLPRFGRRYLLRNHQKLAIADSAQAIIGGFNIEDSYFGRGEDVWRDLGLVVEGAAAARAADYFDTLQAWARSDRARLRDLRRALHRFSEPDGAVRWLLGGPSRRLSPWVRQLRQDLQAGSRADLIAAYFAPNRPILRRIERLAGRGEARIITPAHSDHAASVAAARHCYARLLRRGARIFEYQPIRLHKKLLIVDDVVQIGSANFDMRSLYLNLELMLRVEDAGFADRMRAHFTDELADCEEITVERHRQMATPIKRMLWSVAYFLLSVADASITRGLAFGVERD